jgi:hypothetical protein
MRVVATATHHAAVPAIVGSSRFSRGTVTVGFAHANGGPAHEAMNVTCPNERCFRRAEPKDRKPSQATGF